MFNTPGPDNAGKKINRWLCLCFHSISLLAQLHSGRQQIRRHLRPRIIDDGRTAVMWLPVYCSNRAFQSQAASAGHPTKAVITSLRATMSFAIIGFKARGHACILPLAAGYTYDLVRVAGRDTIITGDTDAAGSYEFVERNKSVTASDLATAGIANTFHITNLRDVLYQVRIRAVNPLNPAGEPSDWSATVGTGEHLGKEGRGC